MWSQLRPIASRYISYTARSNTFYANTEADQSRSYITQPKNPNSVVIRGDIFDIQKREENDNLRITLKVKRQSVTRLGEPYVRSEYFNVNFYSVSDPEKNWKIPKYFTVGDNVSTYSNLCCVPFSDVMYLKGYAMRRHPSGIDTFNEQFSENDDTHNTLNPDVNPVDHSPRDV